MFIKVYIYVSHFFPLSYPPFLIACFFDQSFKLRPFETRESALLHAVFFSLYTVSWYYLEFFEYWDFGSLFPVALNVSGRHTPEQRKKP